MDCKAIKNFIIDEEKATREYEDFAKTLGMDFKNIVINISRDEKRHGEIMKKLFKKYCENNGKPHPVTGSLEPDSSNLDIFNPRFNKRLK